MTRASSGRATALEQQRILASEPFGGVGLEIHRRVDEQLAALVVVGHFADQLAQHVEKRAQNVERFAAVAVLSRFDEFAAAHLLGTQRLEAVLHERVGPHVVVGADHQAAERIHQRAIAVAAVAGSKQILEQALQPLVAQTAVEVGEKLLFLLRSDVVQLVVRLGLFDERKVLGLINGAGVVENDHADRMTVPPEMFVVVFDRFADVAKAVGGNHKKQVVG